MLLGIGHPGTTQELSSLAANTVLSGHLDYAPSGDTVRLRIGTQLLIMPLSPTGDFKLVVPELSQARYGSLSYARQQTSLYLTPGDQLHLTLDFPRFDESLRFTGRGANANNYLAQAFWRFEAEQQPRPEDQLTATTTPGQAPASGGCVPGATAGLSGDVRPAAYPARGLSATGHRAHYLTVGQVPADLSGNAPALGAASAQLARRLLRVSAAAAG